MKLFIDSADIGEIRRLCERYPIDGVTTNPTILARAGGNPVVTLEAIRGAIGEDRLLFVQALPTDAEGMVRDARAIVELLGDATVVKLPAVPEGFRAMRLLEAEGIVTCGTVVYTALQGWLAAKAGAMYVAPYVNRIDNLGQDGVQAAKQLQDILNVHHMEAQVLAASFKNIRQVLSLCACGISAVTCSPDVIEAMAGNPAVDAAIADFNRDFGSVAGGRRSMADLIHVSTR